MGTDITAITGRDIVNSYLEKYPDLYKRCKICGKVMTVNDAFGSDNQYLCEFCNKLVKSERMDSNVNTDQT